MDYYELSASSLAEKINVQRSSISHILSGRNKPSLDFVVKILNTFPEVELFWLLNGVGKFPQDKNTTDSSPTLLDDKKEIKESFPLKNITKSIDSGNNIEQIVIFFKDGTFKNYIP